MLTVLRLFCYKYTVITVMCLVSCQVCFAQDDGGHYTFFQLDWIHATPLDRFGELLDDRRLDGFELTLLRQFKHNEAWFAGLTLSSVTIDRVSQGISSTKSGFWDFSMAIRHYPQIGFWRVDPYLTVVAGLRRLSTVTTIEWSTDDTELIVEDKSHTPLFGVGIGSTVILGRRTHLNLAMTYQSSGAATYYIATGDSQIVPFDNFREVFSHTSTLKSHLGLTFQF